MKKTKAAKNPANKKASGKRGSRRDPPTNAFAPGVSGNPAGRPKDDPELIEAFRARTPKALDVLDKVLDGYLAPPGGPIKPPQAKDAVKAAEVVLDRGWGKAPTTIKVAGHDGGPLKGELLHGLKPPEPPNPQRFANIARVLQEAGVFELAKLEAEKLAAKTETAATVEKKETE